jgi:putative ABC transport system ATP-binding protein
VTTTTTGSKNAVTMTDVAFAWPGTTSFGLKVDHFALARQERLLLIGPSGSGKSTFLSLLCGIVSPQTGTIDVMGNDLTALSSSARDRFRAEHFGIIFQMFNLLPYAGVIDNVLLPLHFAPERRKRAAAATTTETEANRLLDRVGISAALRTNQRAASLSVGQQQRVAAARALIGAPDLIVADEPTSSLDRNRQGQFLDLLFSEAERAASSVIMVSHDESLMSRFDRVVNLADIAVPLRAEAAS